MADVKCVSCKFAKWEKSPSGRISRKVAGRCMAPYPPMPVLLSVPAPQEPLKIGIWPDCKGRCDAFKPLGIDA